jgi:hypothetical protein
MLIGRKAHAVVLHDEVVVLLVVGAEILSFAPLRQLARIAHTHDRCPACCTRALPLEITQRALTVVVQAHGVARFMCHCFGDEFFNTAQVVIKHECGFVVFAD